MSSFSPWPQNAFGNYRGWNVEDLHMRHIKYGYAEATIHQHMSPAYWGHYCMTRWTKMFRVQLLFALVPYSPMQGPFSLFHRHSHFNSPVLSSPVLSSPVLNIEFVNSPAGSLPGGAAGLRRALPGMDQQLPSVAQRPAAHHSRAARWQTG